MNFSTIKSGLASLVGGSSQTKAAKPVSSSAISPRSGIPGPDFVCFGLQKAGTQWLYDQLEVRQDVWMTPIKEISYFGKQCFKPTNLQRLESAREYFRSGELAAADLKRKYFFDFFGTYDPATSDIQWYKDLFKFKEDKKSGDISPYYSKLNDVESKYVSDSLPSTRFIFLVRDPLDRLWSALNMKVRKETLSLLEITDWKKLQKIISSDKKMQINSYPAQVWKRWSSHIPEERIRFWLFDDIVASPENVVDQICDFIGIAAGPGKIPGNFNRKENFEKIEMPPDIRLMLLEYFNAELAECAKLFGSHATGWRDRHLAIAANSSLS